MATRNGTATWNGDLKSGTGQLTVGNGAHTGAFSFKSRFEDGDGTNPEELISTALAACYSMQLSAMLAEKGTPATSVKSTAVAKLSEVDGAPTITEINLETVGAVKGLTDEQFQSAAKEAKEACLIARALSGVESINLSARLA